ncbi:MAG: hypothetical protein V1743_07785 [Nanoarchaeota archaeon]
MVKSSELSFEGLVVENVPRRFRSVGVGRIVDLMPHILNGTDPSTGAQVDVPRELLDGETLMYERVHGRNEQDMKLFQDNYFVIADVLVGNPDGSGEVVFAKYSASPVVRDLVKSLNPASPLVGWSLQVSQDQYQAIREGKNVVIFSPEQAAQLRDNIYTNPDNKRSEYWDVKSGGRPILVRENAELVKSKTGRTFEKNAMGLYIANTQGLRPVWVGSVGDYLSLALDGYTLSSNYARLVGVSAGGAGAENLEVRIAGNITDALKAGKPFIHDGVVYAPIHGVEIKN